MSRALLLPFPLLAGWIGLAYMAGDPQRTATPSFDVARSIAPVSMWGAMFVIGFLVMLAALGTHSVRIMAAALYVGGFVYTWWGVLFLVGALTDRHASLVGWALYGMLAFVHFAAGHYVRIGVIR